MKEQILKLLTGALPAVDFSSDFLFAELDSISLLSVCMILGKEFDIEFDAADITPRNFKTVDSLTALVQSKLKK